MSIFWKVKSNTEYFYQSTEIQKYAKKIKRYRITDLVGEGEETAIGPTAQTLRTRPRVQLYRNIKREIQKYKEGNTERKEGNTERKEGNTKVQKEIQKGNSFVSDGYFFDIYVGLQSQN